ncbi:MAG TPA: hypothetical protein VIZ58_08080 [Thermoanaerobaculia bacterium]
MASKRVPGAIGTAALLIAALAGVPSAAAADLASTYAHDAFPSAETQPPRPGSPSPCRHVRLSRKSSTPRHSVPAGRREGSAASPETAPSDRADRHALIVHPDDDPTRTH